MSYFYRHDQMQEVSKAWGKEINDAWDEADHPRGKTTPESNSGSFMPKGGGGESKPSAAMMDQLGPAAFDYDPEYVNQENWTLSNKQPSPAEMRQHGQKMGQLLRDRADNIPYADQFQQAYLDDMTRMYGKDYAKQLNQRATDEFKNPAEAARTKSLDDAADRQASASYKSPGKITIGAILSSSWGYDQTNVDFYEVTGMSPSGKTATLREVAKIKDYKGDMTGRVRAVPGKYTSGPKARRISTNGGIKVDFGYASLWDGSDKFFSEYA